MSTPRIVRWALRLVAGGVIALGVLAWIVGLLARWTPLPDGYFTPPSTTVHYRDGHLAHVFLSPDDTYRIEVEDLDRIDPRYLDALLAFEDARFHAHPGVDPLAVLRAAVDNLVAGRVVSGASTLTMQLARLREPRPRTLASKLVEAFRALQLEARYDKETLLRKYLTHLPFGGNLEGVEVASRALFGHGPAHLDPGEIATLLAIPQRPTPRTPSPENAARLEQARDHVLDALARSAPFGDRFRDAPPPGPVPTRLRPLPREVPHLAYALRAEDPDRRRFDTTLDRAIQHAAARRLEAARPELEALGIRHGAAAIVDHGTGDVRGLVGNLDFWLDGPGHQIPAYDVPRSVGSTLKPFLYGLALDAGWVLPETLVEDVPRTYGGYRPENYDGRFEGAVRLQDALARSLNLPFVDLLARIGVEPFVGTLVTLGAESMDDRPGRHGLSAAVGALELTPLELAGLYTALARADGSAVVPRILEDRSPLPPRALLGPGAAHLVRDALDDRDRPDFPSRARLRGAPTGIHWKTGTSFAHRDAWAVGSDGSHTVVVWLGNLDRAPSPHLVGAERAGPLFFDLVERLPEPAEPTRPPAGTFTTIPVCALTGRPAGPACPVREQARALAHRVPIEPCPVHVHRWTSPETGLELPPTCAVTGPRERSTFEVWPAAVLRHLGPAARRLPAPPARDPRCAVDPWGPAPRVTAPVGRLRLLVPDLPPSDQEVPLEAAGTGPLSWFVDGRFVGRAEAGERLWWTPTPGRHELLVIDGAGRKARTTLELLAGARGQQPPASRSHFLPSR